MRDAENGCVMPSLSGDVDAQKRKRAWVGLALMVGAITVARALPDGPERQELVAAALSNALKTVEP